MGEQATLFAVESIVDGVGRQIYQHMPQTIRCDPNVAYLMTGGLKAVLRSGTGASSLRLGIDLPAAGGNGTTQDYKDEYFIGYTPEVVCGSRWIRSAAPTGMTGAKLALAAWAIYGVDCARLRTAFCDTIGIEMANIDPASGGLATPSCPWVLRLAVLIGSCPTQPCPLDSGGSSPRCRHRHRGK